VAPDSEVVVMLGAGVTTMMADVDFVVSFTDVATIVIVKLADTDAGAL
jgi:hypothetical protein